MYVAKTKVLISCVVTKQLICAFVFEYAKSRLSHEAAQLDWVKRKKNHTCTMIEIRQTDIMTKID